MESDKKSIHEVLIGMANKAMKEMQDDIIRNCDSSQKNFQTILEMEL